MAKICPKCGNQIKENAAVCGKCGAKLDAAFDQAAGKPASNNALGFIKAHKRSVIGVGALLLAVVLLLIIVNPANSPGSVFKRYLNCLHAQDPEQFRTISYDANFSQSQTVDAVVDGYTLRFSSADSSYNSGGRVDLLKDVGIKVTKTETLKESDLSSRRSALAQTYRNTARITDIRNITFEIKRGEETSTGTAELICVTGKWYIGEVTGI